MRIEPRRRGFEVTMISAATAGASTNPLDRAMSRSELLRALVRAHQHLVEERLQLMQRGAPPDPQIERGLAAIADRITNLLSDRDEKADVRKERAHLFEESLKETR